MTPAEAEHQTRHGPFTQTMTTATTQSRIAHLSESDSEDYPHVVHGVAHGEDELTKGLNGPKFWPADEVEAAAASLEGKPVYRIHDEGNREQIGAVLRAAHEPGVGVVYEAGLEDANVAEDLSIGQREVSIEAGNPSTVDEHADTGAAILRGYEYTALTTPTQGASPGNYTAPGSADQNPAVAALSAAAVEATLDGEDVDVESALASADLAVDAVDLLSAATGARGADAQTSDERAESRAGSSNTDTDHMTDNDDNAPDVDALLERVDEKDEQIDSLESDLEETQAELEAKEDQIEEMEDDLAEAKRDIAARLAEHSDILDEDDYVERFEIAELREKADDLDEATDGDGSDPDVQSGSGGDSSSAQLEDEDADRIEEIEAKLSQVGSALPRSRIEELQDEAAELAGADDYEAALEAI